MRLQSLLVSFFLVLIIVGLLFFSVFILAYKMLAALQTSLSFSPLENNVPLDNTERCSDTDKGIFFNNKGEVSYDQHFLFVSWSSNFKDSCSGNELTEYYCSEGDSVGRGVILCDKCVDGACVQ